MTPIKWKRVPRSACDAAKVDGCKVFLDRNAWLYFLFLDEGPRLTIPRESNQQQIDAAAYALADLVQTLRGLE